MKRGQTGQHEADRACEYAGQAIAADTESARRVAMELAEEWAHRAEMKSRNRVGEFHAERARAAIVHATKMIEEGGDLSQKLGLPVVVSGALKPDEWALFIPAKEDEE